MCDIGGQCYSPMAYTYYNTYILDMLLEVCKVSSTEGVKVFACIKNITCGTITGLSHFCRFFSKAPKVFVLLIALLLFFVL